MRYEGTIYRPPSEAHSLLIQCTIGCPHNRCTFCGMYKDKQFRIRSVADIREDLTSAREYYGDTVRSLFLPEHVCVAVEQLKFQQPIRPYDEAVLHLQRSDLKVSFKLMRGNTSLASGRLYFEAVTGV